MIDWRRSREVYCVLLGAVLGVGCTALLGIDGSYDLGVDASVSDGKSSGGSGGRPELRDGDIELETGGATTSSGGQGGSAGAPGGASGAGGTKDCGEACKPTEKCCAGSCVVVSNPLWGCSLTTCDACTELPDHATGRCDGDQCSFTCIDSFAESAGQCVPADDGGVGGMSSTPACDPTKCPSCNLGMIYSACCQHDGKCGCAFPSAPCFPKP
jgi:hypothetical protein